MKKIIAIGLTMCLALQSLTALGISEETKADDNFNGLRKGDLSVSSWQLTTPLENSEKIHIINRAGKNMAVSIDKPESERSRTIGIKRTDSITSHIFTVEFDIKIAGGTQYVSLRNSNHSYPEIFLLKLSENTVGYNNIDYPVVMPAGTWNNLRIYIDSQNKKLYVYVNRTLTDVGFDLTSAATDDSVEFSAYTNSSTAAAQIQFDNYKLYSGAPRGAIVIDGVPESELELTSEEITPYKELYTQNFNSQSVGEVKNLPSWTIRGASNGSIEIVNAGDERGNAVRFTKNKTSVTADLYSSIKIPATDAEHTVEFYYKHDEESETRGMAYLFNSSGTAPGSVAAMLDGGMVVFNGSVQKTITTGGGIGNWQKITFHIRPEECMFDAYVNGMKVAENYQYRNTSTENTGMVNIGSSSTASKVVCWFDDIKVYEGAPDLTSGDYADDDMLSGKKTLLGEYKNLTQKANSRLKDAIVLCKNENMAYVKNERLTIDESNPLARPVIISNEMYLPYDFAAKQMDLSSVGSSKIIEHNGIKMLAASECAAASGKNLYINENGLIVLSNSERIFSDSSSNDSEIIEFVRNKFENGKDKYSSGKYSDVYVTSRSFRLDGTDGQLGTLDMTKRFMGNQLKWSYATGDAEISSVENLGVPFQGSLTITAGSDPKGRMLKFDGSYTVAPWMPPNYYWNCVNNPVYLQTIKGRVDTYTKLGVSRFQFDDWAGNGDALGWGACFCDYCMDGFRDYLKQKYTAEKLAELGVTDIDSFNYHDFLAEKYDISTNNEYLDIRAKEPLNADMESFAYISVRNFHKNLKALIESSAGDKIEFSHNANNFGVNYRVVSKTFGYDIYDLAMGEINTESMELQTQISSAYLTRGLNKTFIYSTIPEDDNMPLIRKATALAYSMGQYGLVPWDTYVSGSLRYYAAIDEIGDLYHFIRQYPYLFDMYEIPANMGILLELNQATAPQAKAANFSAFEEGIPFRDLVSRNGYGITHSFTISPEDVKGLKYIVTASPLESIKPEEQEIIKNSGAELISVDDIKSKAAELFTSRTDDKNIYTVFRTIPENDNMPKIVHVLNRKDEAATNVGVEINKKYLPEGTVRVMLYRPEKDPVLLTHTVTAQGIRVTVPEMDEWAILRVCGDEDFISENYFENGWTMHSLGTRSDNFAAAKQTADSSFELTSAGRGFNVVTLGDSTGASDQMNFVYKNIPSSIMHNYSVSAKLGDIESVGGLMLREYPSSNSRFAALAYEESHGLVLVARYEDNKTAEIIPLGIKAKPAYAKLENNDGVIYAYTSNDGKNWTKHEKGAALTLKKPIGGVFCASQNGETVKAGFDKVDVKLLDMYATAVPSKLVIEAKKQQVEIDKTLNLNSVCETIAGDLLDQSVIDVKYTSSDESVLKVDSTGKVIPVNTGVATVTAECALGAHKISNTIVITVIPTITEFINESFDEVEIGRLPANWTYVKNTQNGSHIKVVGEPSETDRSLSMKDNVTKNDSSATYVFEEPIDKPLVIEFDFMVRSIDGTRNGVGATPVYVYSSAGEYALSLLVSDTHFWYLDNGVSTNICEYELDKWYQLRVELDPAAKKMVLYIDGECVIADGNFRGQATDFAKILLGANGNAVNAEALWNNFKVYLKK